MRHKLVAAVLAGLMVGMVTLLVGVYVGAWEQDKPIPPRVEYKVIYSPVDHVELKQSVQVDGKLKIIGHGPKESAEAMTKQFNELAAEGWEYVGPVISTGKQSDLPGASGVLTVFRRAKQ